MNREQFLSLKNSIRYCNNNFYSFMVILFNLGLFVISIIFFKLGGIFYILSILLFSIQFNHAFLIVHECVHNSFFTNKHVNIIIGHIASIFAFLPFYARKKEHLEHHRTTLSFKEPSTQRALKTFDTTNKNLLNLLNVFWKLWIPIFAINEHIQIWIMCFRKSGISFKISAYFLMVVYGTIVYWIGFGSCLYLLPALYLYFFLIEFFNLPHHIDAEIQAIDVPVSVWEQIKATKSCAPMPYIGPPLLLNFNFHSAHHLFPSIPWYQLPSVNEMIAHQYPSLFSNYPSEIYEHLRLRKLSIHVVLRKYIDYQALSKKQPC